MGFVLFLAGTQEGGPAPVWSWVTLPDRLGVGTHAFASRGLAFEAAAALACPCGESVSDSHALCSRIGCFESFADACGAEEASKSVTALSQVRQLACVWHWRVTSRLVCSVQSPGLGPHGKGWMPSELYSGNPGAPGPLERAQRSTVQAIVADTVAVIEVQGKHGVSGLDGFC